MKVYNLSNIEEIFLCKIYIESILLENNEIEEKMELQDFISKYMNVSNKVYMKNSTIIPFEIYDFYDEIIIIITENTYKDILVDELKKIEYNLSNLKVIPNNVLFNMFSEDEDNKNLFIINNKYMK